MPTPAPQAPARLAPAALIALAATAAYAGGLAGPFVFDDVPSIVRNPTLGGLASALAPPHGRAGSTVESRPVLNVSLALNHAVSGLDVWSYHLTNLLIHIAAGLALFGIVRRTLEGRCSRLREKPAAGSAPTAVALAAALLWVLHPLQTEAVTYVVQRAESLMGLFYLLTLYGFIRYAERPSVAPPRGAREGKKAGRTPWAILSVLACLFGIGTKEAMVTAPVLVFLYDRTFVSGGFREAWRRHRRLHLALAATWLPLLLLLAGSGWNRHGSIGLGVDVSWGGYLLTQFKAVAVYLKLCAWPHPLVFDYETFRLSPAAAAPYALPVLALAAASLWALVRAPAWGFLGFWFFGLLAPTSLVPGTTQMIVEHRMYLPLAAPAVAAAWGIHALLRRRPRAALGLCLAGAAALGALTACRNRDYRTTLSLWSDTAAKRPGNVWAQENLGGAQVAAGRFAEADQSYRRALALSPNSSRLRFNLAVALDAERRPAEAAAEYEESIRLEPGYAEAYMNLAETLARMGELGPARERAEAGLKLDPGNARAHYNLGLILFSQRDPEAAAAEFQQALRIDPDDGRAHNALGAILAMAGRADEAAAEFEQALRIDPNDPEARANLRRLGR